MRTFENMPAEIAALPRDERGYPIPFFVALVDGKPDLRLACQGKLQKCYSNDLCWVCGQPLRGVYAFLGGPKSVANRIFADFASHTECGVFSAINCPHLNNSNAKRRNNDIPADAITPTGSVAEHPVDVAVYLCRGFQPVRVPSGYLWHAYPAFEIRWFRDGQLVRTKRPKKSRTA